MADFWTADTHFFHCAVVRYCNRPWKNVTKDNMEEHDSAMIALWNGIVSKGDTVRILGDFAWKNHNKYLGRLNGKKILVMGNHDKMPLEVLKNFTQVIPEPVASNCKLNVIKIDGREFYCTHFPSRTWYKSHYGVPNLFGHTHGRMQTWNLSFDVGVDTKLAGLKPIPHEVVLQEIDRRMQMMEVEGRVRFENGKKLWMQDDVSYWRNKFLKQQNEEIVEIQENEEDE